MVVKFAVVTVGLCVILQVAALVDRSQGEPQNRDIRRYVLGEIYDEYRVEQQFVVRGRGLSSVTIHPRPAAPSPTGTVAFTLRDVTADKEAIVHQTSAPVAELARSDSFTMTFPPQPSENRRYSLEIAVRGGSDGQGIGFLAARGAYRRGTLVINGRPRWGNLVFGTTVDDAPTNFGAMAAQLGRAIPAPRVVLLLMLIGGNAALFVVLWAFSRRDDPANAAMPTVRPAPAP